MSKNLISLRDVIKKKESTHTLNSAAVLPDDSELSDSQLELVVGGMSFQKFSEWRSIFLNKRGVK